VFIVSGIKSGFGNHFSKMSSSKTGRKRKIMVCDNQWLSENYHNALKGVGEKLCHIYLFRCQLKMTPIKGHR